MNHINFAETMFLGENFKKKEEKKSTIEQYKEYQKKDQYFQITFSQLDVSGRMVQFDHDTKLVMLATDINGSDYNPRYRADKLKGVYCVKVNKIDETEKIVYVSQHTARQEQKPAVEAELDERIEKQETEIKVKGKVIKIKTKNETGQEVGVWLDLCGIGLMGYVYIGDWNPTYTPSLRKILQYGDVVEVVVKEKVSYDNGFTYYICSRKELIEDPWNEALKEKYHVGDIIKITCKSLEETHWFGEVAGLLNIQVFTEYPSEIHTFKIEVGKEYLGKIYHMDVENHSLKARVFQMLPL